MNLNPVCFTFDLAGADVQILRTEILEGEFQVGTVLNR